MQQHNSTTAMQHAKFPYTPVLPYSPHAAPMHTMYFCSPQPNPFPNLPALPPLPLDHPGNNSPATPAR